MPYDIFNSPNITSQEFRRPIESHFSTLFRIDDMEERMNSINKNKKKSNRY